MVGSMGFGGGFLESTIRTSSWLKDSTAGRVFEKDMFSRIRSRRASPSAVVLWVNEPPAEMSSYRADSLLSLDQKCWSNTWSGMDKSGTACVSCENLAQDAPKDSFSS